MPAFRQVLEAVDRAWREQRAARSSGVGANVRDALRAAADTAPSSEPLHADLLTGAAAGPAVGVRPGLGRLRRRAQVPPRVRRRLPAARCTGARARRMRSRWRPTRSTGWRSAACTTSSAAASTATRSTPCGSCRTSRRCSTTTRCWRRAYLEGFAVTGERRHAAVAERTLDFMLRELRLPEGGFASALDADTDGEEGTTYVWTPAQLREALGDDQARAAATYYGVTDGGELRGSDDRAAGPRRAAGGHRARSGRPCSSGGCSGPSRAATTRPSPAGTGSPWPRWPRAGGGSTGPTCSMPRATAPGSCSGR